MAYPEYAQLLSPRSRFLSSHSSTLLFFNAASSFRYLRFFQTDAAPPAIKPIPIQV